MRVKQKAMVLISLRLTLKGLWEGSINSPNIGNSCTGEIRKRKIGWCGRVNELNMIRKRAEQWFLSAFIILQDALFQNSSCGLINMLHWCKWVFSTKMTVLLWKYFFIKIIKPSSYIIHAELHWMWQTELLLALCIWAYIMKIILCVGQCMWQSHWNVLAGEGQEPWFCEEGRDKGNVFCRKCEKQIFCGKGAQEEVGWDCRERWGVLQTGPNSLRVPWGHKGIS